MIPKIVILGDCGVGKSSYTHAICDMKNIQFPTIGLEVHPYVNDNKYYDIADYSGLYPKNKIHADGAIIMFDVNCLDTYKNVEEWKKCLNSNIPTVIVGNKIDLGEIPINNDLITISVKNKINIQEPINQIINKISKTK